MNPYVPLVAQSIHQPAADGPAAGSSAFDPTRLDRLLREGKRLNAAVRSALTPGVRVGGHIRRAAQLALIDDLIRYQERLERALAELRPLIEVQQQRARALTLYSRALNNAYLPSYRRGTR
ncbi:MULTISPECIES: hypothetical protein [Nitrospirillum]|uniref:Uncharacterized protein n=2 Tax=Nitrospirillum TaxID=1543705 RepID=A0A248JY18_9PROT|nr:hypothetical protein [Nitrospirillum amazonense]ASG23094.1 hypothetical protein Y958_19765 [Nitrospirillum amazonense CBAmc]MEC4595139.1 hypothetical protein [Nitrospirillum amazonense]TWB22870.1 hypothetical protein FBZ88_11516 [Nitrospirillum amazonense]TWB38829.1 hypothetical protein FBZ91_106157 [Nitrospirillum amazonense]